jgi:hypothetical protein
MAAIDTTGRCLRQPLGKARNPSALGAQVQIHFTPLGVVPKLNLDAIAVPSAEAAAAGAAARIVSTSDQQADKGKKIFKDRVTASESTDDVLLKPPQAKKHPVAELQSAKAGEIVPRGKRKMANRTASPLGDVGGAEMAADSNNNNERAAEKNDSSHRNKTNSKNALLTIGKSPRIRLMTAEQNAVRRLERILAASSTSSGSAAAAAAAADHQMDDSSAAGPSNASLISLVRHAVAVGGNVAVDMDRRIRKANAVRDAQREIQQQQQQQGYVSAARAARTGNLGKTSIAACPFATADAASPNMAHYSRRVYSQKFARGVEDTFHPSKAIVGHHNRPRPRTADGTTSIVTSSSYNNNTPPPYDTAEGSVMYPDPPAVGASVSRAALHMGKHQHRVDARQSAAAGETIDEVVLRKAIARCPQSANMKMPDFLFGQPPIASERRVRLGERKEQQFKSQEATAHQKRTGKGYSTKKNASVGLW